MRKGADSREKIDAARNDPARRAAFSKNWRPAGWSRSLRCLRAPPSAASRASERDHRAPSSWHARGVRSASDPLLERSDGRLLQRDERRKSQGGRPAVRIVRELDRYRGFSARPRAAAAAPAPLPQRAFREPPQLTPPQNRRRR